MTTKVPLAGRAERAYVHGHREDSRQPDRHGRQVGPIKIASRPPRGRPIRSFPSSPRLVSTIMAGGRRGLRSNERAHFISGAPNGRKLNSQHCFQVESGPVAWPRRRRRRRVAFISDARSRRWPSRIRGGARGLAERRSRRRRGRIIVITTGNIIIGGSPLGGVVMSAARVVPPPRSFAHTHKPRVAAAVT
jgi:hypothetical protein